jgi:hypothetical protein
MIQCSDTDRGDTLKRFVVVEFEKIDATISIEVPGPHCTERAWRKQKIRIFGDQVIVNSV